MSKRYFSQIQKSKIYFNPSISKQSGHENLLYNYSIEYQRIRFNLISEYIFDQYKKLSKQNSKMLHSYFRTPSRKSQTKQQTFSFIDGFSDQKQQKTMANSIAKDSDFDTTSSCTFGIGTDYQKDEEEYFYSQREEDQSKDDRVNQIEYGISLSKQIIYSSPQQYQQQLQNLLSNARIEQKNKIYLRLIILDKQNEIDNRLQRYFEWAIEQYRLLKEKIIK